jgi:hypothetical protein
VDGSLVASSAVSDFLIPGSLNSVSATRIERRIRTRYPVRLPARYRTLEGRIEFAGVGFTVNVSSGGLLLTCEHEIKPGAHMEIQVDWPSLLESTIPLQLVTSGRVVRSEPTVFAVEFARYQFRTMRSKPFPKSFSCNQTA